jgi:hypothetical protein
MVLYAFLHKFKKLPSEVYDEDPVVMSNLLHIFYEDMKVQQETLAKLEAEFKQS